MNAIVAVFRGMVSNLSDSELGARPGGGCRRGVPLTQMAQQQSLRRLRVGMQIWSCRAEVALLDLLRRC
jgi:hypothetical protein